MQVLSFDSPDISLTSAGGKSLNLSKMYNAGFKVPPGFLISTVAYRSFVKQNQLGKILQTALSDLDLEQTSELDKASADIRAAFAAGLMPAEITTAILRAYEKFTKPPVAVRSSATTEDLPDLSFAGQQDTYLNILDETALLEAVIGCWSSLWTARAIGYRARNGIPHQAAALAVIVQEMVQSDVSGVLFTANPLSGLRSETVIDATFGLGEALVSGQVEPDHFVINSLNLDIEQFVSGSKLVSTRSLKDGGVVTDDIAAHDQRSLDDSQIKQLVALGEQVQSLFGSPQDIEFAYAADQLFVLQSRPITSLYPLPEYSHDPLIAWVAFGTIQGITGPMTPLGREAVQYVLVGAASLFNVKLKPEEPKVFASAGERIWVRISDLIRNPIGNRLFERLMNFIEPSAVAILRPISEDPRLGAGEGKLKFSTVRRVIGFFAPALFRAISTLRHPERARQRFDAEIETFLSSMEIPDSDDRFVLIDQALGMLQTRIKDVFSLVLPSFLPLLGPGMGSLTLLNKLAGDRDELVLEVTRGMPQNVTTEMDLAMWDVSRQIRADEGSRNAFKTLPASKLATHFLAGKLPTIAQRAITDFFSRYGMRGVGEIDLGRPRWREDPTAVMQTLASYMNLEPSAAPDVVFARAEQTAIAAVDALAGLVREQRGGWLKARLVRAAAYRVRTLLGARESPKFFAIRVMGVIRDALLEAGRMFVETGDVVTPDDLFYLSVAELKSLGRGQERNWGKIAAERRNDFQREARRRQVPRVLLSDGRAFYEGVGAETDSDADLTGSPVSPGTIEGTVRIVHDPQDSKLEPGEILVCVGTDPAWTPLFLTASGLITEVGGMMTHGSVVAREYGIPAVVGVHQATIRLRSGQQIKLDGSRGKITLLG